MVMFMEIVTIKFCIIWFHKDVKTSYKIYHNQAMHLTQKYAKHIYMYIADILFYTTPIMTNIII